MPYAGGQAKGTFFQVWTKQTCTYMFSCYFTAESNMKLFLNLLPDESTAKLP